jgi:inner membrane protein
VFVRALATLLWLDNVTHSLFGYALGRACARFGSQQAASPPAQPFERAAIASSVLASNAPDLDFVTGMFSHERRLAYLLEHRGFTHTFVFALLLGLAIGFACALAWRLRGWRERCAICAIGALACAFHIGFDFLNDYGVHPFFPFDNHWYYGDCVFIVEPLLLAVLLPLPLCFALTRSGRVISAVLAAALLLLVWLAGAPAPSALATTGLLGVCCALQRQFGSRASPALTASALIVAIFAIGSQRAEAAVRDALDAAAPSERVLDIASAPVPANPRCFRALVASLDRSGTYRLRIARVGWLTPASACTLLPAQPTAPLSAADIQGSRAVQFESVFSAPAAELPQLAHARCDADAMLRFIRMPFWTRRAGSTLLGDLRYDRAPGLEFAERLLTGICNSSSALPPWVPPRADLLSAAPR